MQSRLLPYCLVLPAVLSACTVEQQPAAVSASTRVMAVDTPPPDYPVELGCLGIGGTTTLKVTIGADGRPSEVAVLTGSGQPRLDESATERVWQWQFRPATRNGQPVAASIQVPVRFNPPQLKPDGCFEIEERLRRG